VSRDEPAEAARSRGGGGGHVGGRGRGCLGVLVDCRGADACRPVSLCVVHRERVGVTSKRQSKAEGWKGWGKRDVGETRRHKTPVVRH